LHKYPAACPCLDTMYQAPVVHLCRQSKSTCHVCFRPSEPKTDTYFIFYMLPKCTLPIFHQQKWKILVFSFISVIIMSDHRTRLYGTPLHGIVYTYTVHAATYMHLGTLNWYSLVIRIR
jgi:hypothetical protein